MSKKILSLTLALITSAQLIACGESGTPSETSSADTTAAEAAPLRPEVSGVPEDTNLGGETISFWHNSSCNRIYQSINPEQSGDILDDTVFNVNELVKERLNCNFEFFDAGITMGQNAEAIRTIILADDTSYDVFLPTSYSGMKNVSQGLYLDLSDAKYLSFDKPWWAADYMREVSIDDSIYALTGDNTIDRTQQLTCYFYNKRLYSDFYGDPDGLFEKVIAGDWTWDELSRMCVEVYSDLNNNEITDKEDRLGATFGWNKSVMSLLYSSELRITERDSDGIPQIVMNNEKFTEAFERVFALARENKGICYIKDNDVSDSPNFSNGSTLFHDGTFSTANNLREMKDDYGIIPVPKLDRSTESYHSMLQETARITVLPVNCQKADAVCAVLEELAYEGYYTAVPTYYETVLKVKYSRDEVSAQMVDLIRDSLVTDIATVYGADFAQLCYMPRQLILEGNNGFASRFASIESNAKTKSEALIEQFLQLEK